MTTLAGVLAILSLLGALAAGFAVRSAAADFFRRLVVRHPDLSHAFPRPGWGTRYGPIRPSYMSYLETRRHLQLPEPELQRAGARVLNLLHVYAVLFTTCVLCALWWNYMHDS